VQVAEYGEVARRDDEVQFLFVLALEGGDLLPLAVADEEAEVGSPPGLDPRSLQVQGVTTFGDLEPSGRGIAAPLALLSRRCTRLVATMGSGSCAGGDRADACAHAVGGSERRGQDGDECGDLHCGVHGYSWGEAQASVSTRRIYTPLGYTPKESGSACFRMAAGVYLIERTIPP
jgi:hypothetical protein